MEPRNHDAAATPPAEHAADGKGWLGQKRLRHVHAAAGSARPAPALSRHTRLVSDSELSDSDGGGGVESDVEGDPYGAAELEAQVADLPLEVRTALQAEGRGPQGEEARALSARERRREFAPRKDRHAPPEMSSKRPVSRARVVIPVSKRSGMDPRFSTLSGEYDRDAFRKRFSFLYNEVLPAEAEEIKNQLKHARGRGSAPRLKAALQRVENQLRDEKQRRARQERDKAVQAEQMTAAQKGAPRFHLKKSELRRRELLARYEQLQKSGKLEQYMEKRRKRNAAKDHRYLPSDRRE